MNVSCFRIHRIQKYPFLQSSKIIAEHYLLDKGSTRYDPSHLLNWNTPAWSNFFVFALTSNASSKISLPASTSSRCVLALPVYLTGTCVSHYWPIAVGCELPNMAHITIRRRYPRTSLVGSSCHRILYKSASSLSLCRICRKISMENAKRNILQRNHINQSSFCSLDP